MPSAQVRLHAAGTAAFLLAVTLLLGSGLTASSAGDLQTQISAGKSAVARLASQIAAEDARLHTTTHGLADANRRLAAAQRQLAGREAELGRVQAMLIKARDQLVDLENRLEEGPRHWRRTSSRATSRVGPIWSR
jgi:chromosome segregation ATPase